MFLAVCWSTPAPALGGPAIHTHAHLPPNPLSVAPVAHCLASISTSAFPPMHLLSSFWHIFFSCLREVLPRLLTADAFFLDRYHVFADSMLIEFFLLPPHCVMFQASPLLSHITSDSTSPMPLGHLLLRSLMHILIDPLPTHVVTLGGR